MEQNNPEYILEEVLDEVVLATKAAMGIPVLRFDYGTVMELNTKLKDWNESSTDRATIYPLVWAQEPFTIVRDASVGQGFYGRAEGLNIFIIAASDKNYTAQQRMANVFKPIILPIYRAFQKQLVIHTALSEIAGKIPHRFTNRYIISEFNDDVDCSVMVNTQFMIYDNPNCSPFTNFI